MALVQAIMMRALISLCLLAIGLGAFSPLARAEDLQTALKRAAETSPQLAAARAEFNVVRKQYPLAWAEALPQISAEGMSVRQEGDDRTPSTHARDQDEYWIASLKTSTLLFASGRVYASTRQARAEIVAARARLDESTQSLFVETAKAYAEVLYARAAFEAQQRSVSGLARQAAYVRAHVQRGFLTKTDLAQAEARFALARAEAAAAATALVRAEETFRRLSGRPAGPLEANSMLKGLPDSLDKSIDLGARRHPAILAAEADQMAARHAVERAWAQGRVRVSVETTHSALASDEAATGQDENESSVALRMSVPLFAGGAVRAGAAQQKFRREAAGYRLTEQRLRTREAVIVAWSNLETSRARREATQLALEAARLANTGIQREQDFGQRSVIDVLNQEQELLRAEIESAAAARDLIVAEVRLADAVGVLLELVL